MRLSAEQPEWYSALVQILEQHTQSTPTVDEMRELVALNAPDILFRYRSDCTRSRDELARGRIWLSPPEKYNDPYDCTFSLSMNDVKREIERALVADVLRSLEITFSEEKLAAVLNSAHPVEAVAQIIEGFSKGDAVIGCVRLVAQVSGMLAGLRRRARVCSFSQTHCSVLMWSHYARYHTGFCVEYPTEKLLQISRFQLFPVVYSPQLYDLTELARDLVLSEAGGLRAGQLILPLLQKWEVWRYEQEWRAITFQGIEDLGFACDIGPPSCVYLGSRMPHISQAELRRTCDTHGIAVRRMELSFDRYQLVSVAP